MSGRMMKHLAKKIGVCLALWCCLLFITALAFEDDEDGESVGQKRQVNFASVSAGAVVLESSPKANGYHHLLNDDKDKYGISPCAEKKWLVIGLSEDVLSTILFSHAHSDALPVPLSSVTDCRGGNRCCKL
jgi:hypothetical protein